jgi:hypothetical protein
VSRAGLPRRVAHVVPFGSKPRARETAFEASLSANASLDASRVPRPAKARWIPTIDFTTEKDTSRHYRRAKIIDMFSFEEGYKRSGRHVGSAVWPYPSHTGNIRAGAHERLPVRACRATLGDSGGIARAALILSDFRRGTLSPCGVLVRRDGDGNTRRC